MALRSLTPLPRSVRRYIADVIERGLPSTVWGRYFVNPLISSENRAGVEISSRYFLWSILYEMWCSDEDTHPGVGDGILKLWAWPWGCARTTPALVATVPVNSSRDFSGLPHLCDVLLACEEDPCHIHKFESAQLHSTRVQSIHGIPVVHSGWQASGKVGVPPFACPHGLVHPYHYDFFGRCRCESNAVIHYPLLAQWGF